MKIYSLMKIPEKEPVTEWVEPIEEVVKEIEPQAGQRESQIEQIEPQAARMEQRRVEEEQSRQIGAVETKKANKNLLWGFCGGLLVSVVVLICVFVGMNGDGTEDGKPVQDSMVLATEGPVVTEKPVATNAPVATEKPVVTATPASTLAPVIAIDSYDKNVIALLEDGTVIADANEIRVPNEKYNVSEWSDIVSVSAGKKHVVGLKSDGTVVATGRNSEFQCNVSEWADIVEIGAGDLFTVGLKADGTVVVAGKYYSDSLSEQTKMKAIDTGFRAVYCLDAKGNCFEFENDRQGYSRGKVECVSFCSSIFLSVGIDIDGNGVLIYVNENLREQDVLLKEVDIDVIDWTNLVAVDATYAHVLGLRSDGTVVASGQNDFGQCNVSEWKDIVAISAGEHHSIGIKEDGTIVTAGDVPYDVANLSGK